MNISDEDLAYYKEVLEPKNFDSLLVDLAVGLPGKVIETPQGKLVYKQLKGETNEN